MGSGVRRTRPRAARCTTAWFGLALSVILGAATGCTDTTRPAEDDRPTPAPATSTGPVRPDPNYERPHSAAGADLLTVFPSPTDLGRGWGYADAIDKDPDPGGVEVAAERDVADIMQGSIPQGCRRADPLPVPVAAAEVRYVFEGTPVSAFVLGFDNRAATSGFLRLLVGNLETCRAENGGELVGRVDPVEERVVLSERFPDQEDERRADLAILTDSSVVLLEAAVHLGTAPFTSEYGLRIAEAFREAAHDPPPWVTQP